METNVSIPVVSKSQGQAPLPMKRVAAEPIKAPQPREASGVDQQLAQAEAKRLARLRQAADTFAISDQRFTIYKDTSGQYITRFTSLRDGKVTYLPEPSVLSFLNGASRGIDHSISLDV